MLNVVLGPGRCGKTAKLNGAVPPLVVTCFPFAWLYTGRSSERRGQRSAPDAWWARHCVRCHCHAEGSLGGSGERLGRRCHKPSTSRQEDQATRLAPLGTGTISGGDPVQPENAHDGAPLGR